MSSFLLPNAAFLAGGALEEAIANTSDGLLTGEIIPLVGNTQKSPDFMEFLKILDKNNRGGQDTIRIILDSHSAHKPKETLRFLNTIPDGKFEFVFTTKHRTWLNIIENMLFKHDSFCSAIYFLKLTT